MTIPDAKKILLLYRPGTGDGDDPQIAEALKLARSNSELGDWLEQHKQFQNSMREKFLEIPVPPELKENILLRQKVRRLPVWRTPVSLRMAACILLLFGICVAVFSFWNEWGKPDKFADYESRMIRSALREYHMDIVTNNLSEVRHLMASKGAPADFPIPSRLAQLQLTGGGVLRWRNHPVSMVCFDRGDNQMLFLFVMQRAAVADPPSEKAELEQISKLAAASWTEGDKTFLLAGPEKSDLRKYL
jgi:hypothetical protein